MPITLVRIDDRLVHGQVVESWIPQLKINCVAVVSDAAAADSTQQLLMRLALPEDIKLEVLSVSAGAQGLAPYVEGKERTLVLAPGPKEVLSLLDQGISLKTVNVGGLHYSAGRVRLGKMIFLDEEDRQAMRSLVARGIVLEGQTVPSESKTDIADLLCDARA